MYSITTTQPNGKTMYYAGYFEYNTSDPYHEVVPVFTKEKVDAALFRYEDAAQKIKNELKDFIAPSQKLRIRKTSVIGI